uniref:Uncharacterized protein n=1 Tax=Polytomella parva TaxID=51329 RepID=A0A7S0UQZ6_9CHLO|mmetsp:Transcript_1831/g.2667  ORF Transcript_1831/g.2667 Transcript_1831/m.2667 type:complete len:966 (+) Transcript_1831:55-2952(+)
MEALPSNEVDGLYDKIRHLIESNRALRLDLKLWASSFISDLHLGFEDSKTFWRASLERFQSHDRNGDEKLTVRHLDGCNPSKRFDECSSSIQQAEVYRNILEQLLYFFLEEFPKEVVSFLLDLPEVFERFFLERPRCIHLFFSHFSVDGFRAFRLGARALARFCLRRREDTWSLLVWGGRHPQAPVTVASKPHYFCELDLDRSVKNLARKCPSFWTSEEWREAVGVEDGRRKDEGTRREKVEGETAAETLLQLDPGFFVGLLLDLLLKGEGGRGDKKEGKWEEERKRKSTEQRDRLQDTSRKIDPILAASSRLRHRLFRLVTEALSPPSSTSTTRSSITWKRLSQRLMLSTRDDSSLWILLEAWLSIFCKDPHRSLCLNTSTEAMLCVAMLHPKGRTVLWSTLEAETSRCDIDLNLGSCLSSGKPEFTNSCPEMENTEMNVQEIKGNAIDRLSPDVEPRMDLDSLKSAAAKLHWDTVNGVRVFDGFQMQISNPKYNNIHQSSKDCNSEKLESKHAFISNASACFKAANGELIKLCFKALRNNYDFDLTSFAHQIQPLYSQGEVEIGSDKPFVQKRPFYALDKLPSRYYEYKEKRPTELLGTVSIRRLSVELFTLWVAIAFPPVENESTASKAMSAVASLYGLEASVVPGRRNDSRGVNQFSIESTRGSFEFNREKAMQDKGIAEEEDMSHRHQHCYGFTTSPKVHDFIQTNDSRYDLILDDDDEMSGRGTDSFSSSSSLSSLSSSSSSSSASSSPSSRECSPALRRSEEERGRGGREKVRRRRHSREEDRTDEVAIKSTRKEEREKEREEKQKDKGGKRERDAKVEKYKRKRESLKRIKRRRREREEREEKKRKRRFGELALLDLVKNDEIDEPSALVTISNDERQWLSTTPETVDMSQRQCHLSNNEEDRKKSSFFNLKTLNFRIASSGAKPQTVIRGDDFANVIVDRMMKALIKCWLQVNTLQ